MHRRLVHLKEDLGHCKIVSKKEVSRPRFGITICFICLICFLFRPRVFWLQKSKITRESASSPSWDSVGSHSHSPVPFLLFALVYTLTLFHLRNKSVGAGLWSTTLQQQAIQKEKPHLNNTKHADCHWLKY